MNKDTIILNLQERFKAMEYAVEANCEGYTTAVLEYADLIGTSEILSNVIKELAMEREIEHELLQKLFNYSTIRRGARNITHKFKPGTTRDELERKATGDDIGIPKFLDKEIDEKYRLMQGFYNLILLEDKRLKKSQQTHMKIEEVFLPEDEKQSAMTDFEELLKFRILHNKILAKLSDVYGDSRKVSFDTDESKLFIGGKYIQIKKFGDEYHTLRIIFEKPEELSKEWFYSEIAEEYDKASPPRDKKFYNAIYQICLKLKTIGIYDLFITTRQSVKINKIYLS